MDKNDIKTLISIILIILIGAGLAIAGSIGTEAIEILGLSIPLYALCIILAFTIQWIAFIPAYIFKTEKFYDLTGSLTYITLTILAVILGPAITIRTILLMVLVLIWTSRLGFYLFKRILKTGEDKRFAELKQSFTEFLRAWTLQGLWISFTLAAALAAITYEQTTPYQWYDWAGMIGGFIVWLIGFGFEAIADYQKSKFLSKPENEGKFINTGLWSTSRHPNYFGEIVIWIGVAIIALPTLQSWRFFTLVSPVFVALLITQISGVPISEKRTDERWGGQEDYEEYKKNTPVLIPIKLKK